MFNTRGGGKSLLICATPLQILIAERIIALHPSEDFYAIILYEGENPSPKLKFYSERLIAQCTQGGCIYRDLSPFEGKVRRVWGIISRRLKFWWMYQYNKIYVASYEYFSVRILLGNLRKDFAVWTYDDGLINLSPSTYSVNKTKDWGAGGFSTLLGVLPVRDVLSHIQGHYTIYDGYNAAYDKPTKIELFAFEGESVSANVTEVVKLFLGQPIFEPDDEASRAVTQAAIEASGCNYYLPHPRETYRIEGIEYIETNYIAEDYLLQELKNNPNRCYKLYSFFTTTMINLQGHPRISSVACRPSNLEERWVESYDILRERGIPIIDL